MLGVRALAEFREAHAQSNNIPHRGKDDALIGVASAKPNPLPICNAAPVAARGPQGRHCQGILATVSSALALPPEHLPKVDKKEDAPDSNPALSKCCVLLKAKTEHLGVAAKPKTSASDLDAMAAGEQNRICAAGGPRCSGMSKAPVPRNRPCRQGTRCHNF